MSAFTALNNTKKSEEDLTLHHMGIFFYKLTYWDKILNPESYIFKKFS